MASHCHVKGLFCSVMSALASFYRWECYPILVKLTFNLAKKNSEIEWREGYIWSDRDRNHVPWLPLILGVSLLMWPTWMHATVWGLVGYEGISWTHHEFHTGWICGLACAALLDACWFTEFCVILLGYLGCSMDEISLSWVFLTRGWRACRMITRPIHIKASFHGA